MHRNEYTGCRYHRCLVRSARDRMGLRMGHIRSRLSEIPGPQMHDLASLKRIGPPISHGDGRPGNATAAAGDQLCGCGASGTGRLRRSAMNWSNSACPWRSAAVRGNRGIRAARLQAAAASRCGTRRRRDCRSSAARPIRRPQAAEGLHTVAHAAHLLFHARHLALPAIAAVTTHVSAPEREGEDREADRPPEDESEDHQHDPAGVHPDRGTPKAVPVIGRRT